MSMKVDIKELVKTLFLAPTIGMLVYLFTDIVVADSMKIGFLPSNAEYYPIVAGITVFGLIVIMKLDDFMLEG